MKFLVLFVGIAVIGAVSADVSHLAKHEGYSYERPSHSHHSLGESHSADSSAGLLLNEAVETETVEHSSGHIGQSYSTPIVDSYGTHQKHSHSHESSISESNSQIIYGKPNSDVLAPVYHQPSLSASGPAYPAIGEEQHETSAEHHHHSGGQTFAPIDSQEYLPPLRDASHASTHEYSAPVQAHQPTTYSSPALIEQKLHGEHHSAGQFSPSQDYLPPQDQHHGEHHHHEQHQQHQLADLHHHEAHQIADLHHHEEHQHADLHHLEQHRHEDQHHEHQLHEHEHHHQQHNHELHHSAAPTNYAAPAAHHHHHHEEYSLPASQTGGYHYDLPQKRYRHRS